MLVSYLVVALMFYLISIFLFNIYELDEDTNSRDYFASRIFLLVLSLFWIIVIPFVVVLALLMLLAIICSFLVVALDSLVSFLVKLFRKK